MTFPEFNKAKNELEFINQGFSSFAKSGDINNLKSIISVGFNIDYDNPIDIVIKEMREKINEIKNLVKKIDVFDKESSGVLKKELSELEGRIRVLLEDDLSNVSSPFYNRNPEKEVLQKNLALLELSLRWNKNIPAFTPEELEQRRVEEQKRKNEEEVKKKELLAEIEKYLPKNPPVPAPNVNNQSEQELKRQRENADVAAINKEAGAALNQVQQNEKEAIGIRPGNQSSEGAASAAVNLPKAELPSKDQINQQKANESNQNDGWGNFGGDCKLPYA